ncbi:microtubule-associated tumor suppressor 1 isoform X2 [Sardina pilchardus]|uniref:microtubule-associated tumor suppressor 1 isoform X2 n=1 Tax=Sardina pilchardus TaxID=27697 RepID=UPI002E149831
MSAVQPVERSSSEGLRGHSEGTQRDLTLTFRDGDQNGNAFADSSSSSSSSSSPSSRGESSPESVRSSCSLSSGRSSSPLDVDMQECPQKLLTGTTGINGTSGTNGHVESTSCHIEGTKETSVLAPDSMLQQPPQHDCSESNDNSVSVYLDARENDDDTTWNNNENLALVFIQDDTSGDRGDIHGDHYGNLNGSRRRYSEDSPAPLCSSENDDIDDDDDDDDNDQEDSFLSMSSGDMVMRSNSISLDGSERALSSISVLADSSTSSSSSDQEPLPLNSPLPGKEAQDQGSPSLVAPGGPEDPEVAEVADQALAEEVGPAFAVDEGVALAEDVGLAFAVDEGVAVAEDVDPAEVAALAEDVGPAFAVGEGLTLTEVVGPVDEGVALAEDVGAVDEGVALAEDVGAVDEGVALAEEPQQEEEPVDVAAEIITVGVLLKQQQEEGEVQEGTAKLTAASVTDDVKVEAPTLQEKDPLRVRTSAPVGGVASAAAVRKAKEPPAAANRGNHATSATRPLRPAKPGKNDVKTFPMPDLKNVKSKIMSRPPSAVTRVARGDLSAQGRNTGPSPTGGEKRTAAASPRPVQGRQDGQGRADARRRSSSCQSRVSAPKPAVPHVPRMAPPSRPRRKALLLNSAPRSSVGIFCGGPEEAGRVEESVPDEEERVEKRAGGDGEAASPDITDGPETAADPAVKEQSAEPPEDGDQTVSSKLGPKTGLPTAVASVTTAAAAAATARAGASAATSASGTVPAPTSLAVGAAPGTSAASRAKAGAGPSATSGRDARAGVGNGSPPRGRQIQPAGIPKMRLPERSLAAAQAAPPAASKASQNAPGAGSTRLPSSSKLPVKGLSTSLSSSSLGSAASENYPTTTARGPNSAPGAKATSPDEKPSRPAPLVGPQVPNKPLATKLAGMRNRTTSIPGKSSITGLKTPALSKQPHSPLQRSASTRLNRANAAATVDKNKPRQAASSPAPAPVSSPASPPAPVASARAAGTHASVPPQPPAPPAEKPLGIAHYRQQCERKSQCIQQLRKLLLSGNRRLEALALVVQHVFAEREEFLKQKKDLTGELSSIKQELAGSVSCCERLEKEKEEAQLTFEETLQKLREEHQEELVQLEERLRTFYSAEWDKTHQAYQEEADKCRALMQQQVEDVRSKQEALRQEQEALHAQQMETLRQQNEATLQELQKTHEQNMNALDKTLKDSEASLSRQIEELAVENNELKTKLQAEEERRRILSEKSQKDAHTLYLEQELESLKVVLEMKTQQLHQQDKKLMQMDKTVETNAKLEECLIKVQQENEDYRARMDKHQALSRQLSSEQAMLQQTLQKESKVNKRLSMENEELLWKLHNGDLSSPRRLSPTSPFHSPRNSASFPTAPLSPR